MLIKCTLPDREDVLGYHGFGSEGKDEVDNFFFTIEVPDYESLRTFTRTLEDPKSVQVKGTCYNNDAVWLVVQCPPLSTFHLVPLGIKKGISREELLEPLTSSALPNFVSHYGKVAAKYSRAASMKEMRMSDVLIAFKDELPRSMSWYEEQVVDYIRTEGTGLEELVDIKLTLIILDTLESTLERTVQRGYFDVVITTKADRFKHVALHLTASIIDDSEELYCDPVELSSPKMRSPISPSDLPKLLANVYHATT